MNMNRTPPWSAGQSLNEMTEEAGIHFDEFVAAMKEDLTVEELAKRFKVSETAIESLKEQFITRGISSVVGGD